MHWLSAYRVTDTSRGSYLDEMSHSHQVTEEQNQEVVPGTPASTNPEGRPGRLQCREGGRHSEEVTYSHWKQDSVWV